MDKIAKTDWKFVKVDPDPNFDPKHNRRIIDEVIKESEKISRQRRREFAEGLGERASALAQFISSVQLGGRNEEAEKYFGKKMLNKLKGVEQKRKNQSEDGLTVIGKNGKVLRRPYEVNYVEK
jgi:hypothetical protein